MIVNWVSAFYFITVFLELGSGTLSKGDKKKVKTKKESYLPHFDPKLIREKVFADDIIENHMKTDESNGTKNFYSNVLGYVTPWNNLGYDIAKWFGPKFSMISPVWLQIRRNQNGGFIITGDHDIDQNWVSDVRAANPNGRFVPRLLFDGWSNEDYTSLFSNEYVTNACTATILDFIKNNKFDGVVVEIWSQLSGRRNTELIHFLNHLGEDLRSADKLFVLVIPPPVYGQQRGFISRNDFNRLKENVDFFSLMTYDFPNRSPGPNSPINWIKDCVLDLVPSAEDKKSRAKILLGLNFYGYKYLYSSGEPVVGNWFVQTITKHKPKITWDTTSAEHFTTFTTNSVEHTIYYPSLYSIDQRLKLAKKLGTGISIWEIGQGLNYFYNLL